MATRDYSSIYTIQEFFLNEIAPKYLPMEDVSLHNIGLYGMITDIIGTTTEDSFNVTDRYINEMMPARAELTDFIYSYAALYGVTNILASPARMPFVLYVRESDVVNNGTWLNDVHTFEIDASISIFADKLPFSIPHNIVISSTYFRGAYTHRAYFKENFNNEIYKDTNPYIKLFKTMIEHEYWIGIRVDVYQYLRSSTDYPIITNSILNIPYVNVSYSNQLCNFEVLYKPYDSDEYIQLEKRMETQVPVTSPFVYYKIIDDQTIRLSFANDDRYFVPGYNSTIRVYRYETNSIEGNFKYRDDIDISVSMGNTQSEELKYAKSVSFFGLMQNDSEGGVAQLGTEDIKKLYLEKMISINSYTTDTDLNLHYLNFAGIYNNNAIMIQYRDDYANREFGCFSRLTDGTDIYPTNTLDLYMTPNKADKHFMALRQYIVKPGRRYGYSSDTSRDTIVPLDENVPSQEIEYTTFALMVIGVRPNSVHYYMNSVNKIVDIDYTYMNINSVLNFLVQDCTISRNAILGENKYVIDITVSRVDGVTTVINEKEEVSPFGIIPDNVKMLMIFDTGDNHYIEMTYIKPEKKDDAPIIFHFQAILETDDMIDDERISISGLTNGVTNVKEEHLIQMYNTQMKFCVFYKYDNPSLSTGHEFSGISDLESYSLCNEYTPLDGEFYFAYPLTLMRSHVLFADDFSSDDGWAFQIKQVPLFGRDFLLGLKDNSSILTSIISQHEFLISSMKDICANFTINIKFYNTYGKSRLFYIGVDKKKSKTLLNKVHCTLGFKIKFFDGVVVENYLQSIKIFIKKYLEGLNMVDDGSNKLHISVLIQKLHNEFSCIEMIIFEGLNDYDSKIQNVQLESLLTTMVNPNTVPEFLTIKEDDISITTVTN